MATLDELNSMLFEQMKRLSDTTDLESEVERSKAMSSAAKTIIEGCALQLKAAELKAEHNGLRDGDISSAILEHKPYEIKKVAG
jgi:hypothetical protein